MIKWNVPIKKRLLLGIKKKGSCWLWQKCRNSDGYGSMKFKGKMFNVHRLSMYAFRGFNLNNSLCVLHKCDKRNCINPNHLFLGTKADNSRDMRLKNRAKNQYTKHKNAG